MTSELVSNLRELYQKAKAEESAARNTKELTQKAIKIALLRESGMEGKVIVSATMPYGILVSDCLVWEGDDKIAGYYGLGLRTDGKVGNHLRLIYADRITAIRDYEPVS